MEQPKASIQLHHRETPDVLLTNPVSKALTFAANAPFYATSGTFDLLYKTVPKERADEVVAFLSKHYPPKQDVHMDVNDTSITGQFKRLWELRHDKSLHPAYRLLAGGVVTTVGLIESKLMKRDWTNPFNNTIVWMHPSGMEGIQKYAHLSWLKAKHPAWGALMLAPIGSTVSEYNANRLAHEMIKHSDYEKKPDAKQILAGGVIGAGVNDGLHALPHIEAALRYTPMGGSLLSGLGGFWSRAIPAAVVGGTAAYMEWRAHKKDAAGTAPKVEMQDFFFEPERPSLVTVTMSYQKNPLMIH